MRLTIHLDTFDRVNPMAFAILWLDNETRQWSREGHMGLELPEWGALHVDCGNTLICGPHDSTPCCVLEGLDLNATSGPFEGETGRAQWCWDAGRSLMTGHWHVQCVDNENTEPEDGIFAADGNPLGLSTLPPA
ncbi:MULTISPECIES: DUF3564 domain-containing protein [Paraburkholderia]|uniref:DUF3564 domain-containing protein n=1 Tax=Paraburkholderia madseniana TaxID=2599607 RepID=A0A6N6WEW0_9BURK|nr:MULTISPECIES: DUF3564 domain-containing protein [Paraburkholderia]KAE8759177.1 DUF3564 family protein [Paraburkholderia madseniana]MCX4145163.1 DUF3564 domain-containing protein [Paraburkholderia madseniana]MDN7148114.1 DUF3564 domain-containing protein [Paraburkholderia sp. WS6]MDQ6406994.1 DUF3564 domain-containing protein [Paraburkholderia madseniana]